MRCANDTISVAVGDRVRDARLGVRYPLIGGGGGSSRYHSDSPSSHPLGNSGAKYCNTHTHTPPQQSVCPIRGVSIVRSENIYYWYFLGTPVRIPPWCNVFSDLQHEKQIA